MPEEEKKNGGETPLEADKKFEIEYQYAWDWFSYHAAQRLTTLRFYFILVGILGAGFFKCVEKEWRGLGFLTASFGAVTSIAFWLLEVRNTELVNCGRDALDKLETKLSVGIRKSDRERKFLLTFKAEDGSKQEGAAGWFSGIAIGAFGKKIAAHRFWLRVIQFLVGLAFAAAAVWAGLGYSWGKLVVCVRGLLS